MIAGDLAEQPFSHLEVAQKKDKPRLIYAGAEQSEGMGGGAAVGAQAWFGRKII
jgi:hypothetical protein